MQKLECGCGWGASEERNCFWLNDRCFLDCFFPHSVSLHFWIRSHMYLQVISHIRAHWDLIWIFLPASAYLQTFFLILEIQAHSDVHSLHFQFLCAMKRMMQASRGSGLTPRWWSTQDRRPPTCPRWWRCTSSASVSCRTTSTVSGYAVFFSVSEPLCRRQQGPDDATEFVHE